VVLTFNDDRCEDLCTLLAESVVAANHDLGAHQNKVAFVSINANSYYPRVSDVKAWTDGHGLAHTANWYFGTGTPKQLGDAADAYEVPITRDAQAKTVEHGSEVFYIDPQGREAGIGGFGNTSANTEIYGHDMAQLAMSLLPRSERSAVGGTSGPPAEVSGGLGSSPAPMSVPALMTSGSVSTAADPKHYTVLNFWSSSCTACITELPGFEAVHAMYGNAVDFLGVDVADNAALGRKLAATTGIDYPVGNDATGKVSGSFQVAELPFTVILDPSGKVAIRHPGLFTVEQLAYVLEDLQPSLQKLDTLGG
jgi:thiol-disulfide isomerase/thioredoxin